MTRLVLYTTAGCHLCEEAAALLELLVADAEYGAALDIDAIDISSESTLVDAYGIRIPVVKNLDTSVELGWPFSLEELRSLLSG